MCTPCVSFQHHLGPVSIPKPAQQHCFYGGGRTVAVVMPESPSSPARCVFAGDWWTLTFFGHHDTTSGEHLVVLTFCVHCCVLCDALVALARNKKRAKILRRFCLGMCVTLQNAFSFRECLVQLCGRLRSSFLYSLLPLSMGIASCTQIFVQEYF